MRSIKLVSRLQNNSLLKSELWMNPNCFFWPFFYFNWVKVFSFFPFYSDKQYYAIKCRSLQKCSVKHKLSKLKRCIIANTAHRVYSCSGGVRCWRGRECLSLRGSPVPLHRRLSLHPPAAALSRPGPPPAALPAFRPPARRGEVHAHVHAGHSCMPGCPSAGEHQCSL